MGFGQTRRSESMKTNPNITEPRPLQWLLIGTALAFLLLMLVVPLTAVFYEALREGWQTYLESLTNPEARAAIRLTLIAAAIVVPVNAVLGIAMAWLLTRFDFRGKQLFTTLLDLPAILKLIWDGSFVNRTATYRSPQHTLRLYRNGSFELEYEPGKAELAACEGEIDCGCSGDWRREADKLHLFHGSAPLVCFAIAQANGREYLLAEHPDPPFRLHGVHLFRRESITIIAI